MVVVFANNQTMVAIGAQPKVIFSDPVPLGENDRASAQFTVHVLDKTGGTTLTQSWIAQLSNDGGQVFLDVTTGLEDSTVATGTRPLVVSPANGVLMRIKFTLQNTGAASTDVATSCFDLHVNVDHA